MRKEIIEQIYKGALKLLKDYDDDPRYDDVAYPPGIILNGYGTVLANGRQYYIEFKWIPSYPSLLKELKVKMQGKLYDLSEMEKTI